VGERGAEILRRQAPKRISHYHGCGKPPHKLL